MKTVTGIPVMLFLTFFSFFASFAPLGQVVSDTAYSVETAKSLYYRHTFAIEKTWELRFAEQGRGGQYFSKFGLGYALSFLPQIAVSHLLSRVVHFDKEYVEKTVVSFTNTFYAAGTAAAMFVLMSVLGYHKRRAFLTVSIIAAASILLPYSKIIQSETLTAFILVLFLIAVAYDRGITVKPGCVLGIMCAALYFIKPTNLVIGLVVVLYVLVRFVQKRATVAGLTAFCCTAILPGFVILYFNWYRFGSLIEFGYGQQQFQFTTPLVNGLAGFLFAPSKSVFIFSPLLIFCLWSFKRFYKRQPRIAICIFAVSALYLAFFARWFDWKGGWAWGPRLIVPAMITAHIVLIEFLDRDKMNRKTLVFFALVAALSTGVQFLGSMVSYQQIHYFHSDPFSLKNSQIEVAARLFIHKAQGKKEQYPREMFQLDRDSVPYERDGKIFGGKVLSFDDKETFQGFATMWSGLSRNFGWRVCAYVPVLLVLISVVCGWRVYRKLPALEGAPETRFPPAS